MEMKDFKIDNDDFDVSAKPVLMQKRGILSEHNFFHPEQPERKRISTFHGFREIKFDEDSIQNESYHNRDRDYELNAKIS